MAVLTDGGVVLLDAIGYDYGTMNGLIRRTDRKILAEIAAAAERAPVRLPLEAVRLLAPVPHPVRDVVCMGLNYKDHANEMADALALAMYEPKRYTWEFYGEEAQDVIFRPPVWWA